MSNLIQVDDSGNWGVKGLPWSNLYAGQVITKETSEKLYTCLEKLMKYEDIGLTPEQLLEIDRMYQEQCRKVAELKEQLYEATVIDEDYEELAETVERFVRTDLLAHVIGNILDEDRVKTIDDLTEYLNNELSCEV